MLAYVWCGNVRWFSGGGCLIGVWWLLLACKGAELKYAGGNKLLIKTNADGQMPSIDFLEKIHKKDLKNWR